MMKGNNTCCCVGVLIGVAIIGAIFGVFIMKKTSSDVTELKQVHVVFCHGERTPTLEEAENFMLINGNESYFPHGFDALTNDGKLTMFKTGEMLRNTYDKFMTRIYRQEESSMETVDMDISKISALLVLAGLWPTEKSQRWTDIDWQPIPFKNAIAKKDSFLFETNCPLYAKEKEKITSFFQHNILIPYQEVFVRLSSLAGIEISTPSQALQFYNYLTSRELMMMKNPKGSKNLKKSMKELAKMEYNIKFYNLLMRKLSAGAFLQKLLSNSYEHIAADKKGKVGVKMNMYSGFSSNLASIIAATETIDPRPQKFGAALMIELHYSPKLNDYVIKLLNWESNFDEAQILKLSQCDVLCPIKDFEDQIKSILVNNYEEECKI